MATYENGHLTTEQLSAYIDNQLSTQEQAICQLHLQSCEQCQASLAMLQQTVALLKALPPPALPRSFVLPTGVAYLQEQPLSQNTPTSPANRRVWPSYLRRSFRTVSAIAAVVGLIFLLAGVLPTLHLRGAGSSASTGGAASPRTLSPSETTNTAGGVPTVQKGTGVRTPAAEPGNGTPTPPVISTPGRQRTAIATPPLFDLNTDTGRQEIGWLLLALGVLGFLLTRRRRAIG